MELHLGECWDFNHYHRDIDKEEFGDLEANTLYEEIHESIENEVDSNPYFGEKVVILNEDDESVELKVSEEKIEIEDGGVRIIGYYFYTDVCYDPFELEGDFDSNAVQMRRLSDQLAFLDGIIDESDEDAEEVVPELDGGDGDGQFRIAVVGSDYKTIDEFVIDDVEDPAQRLFDAVSKGLK